MGKLFINAEKKIKIFSKPIRIYFEGKKKFFFFFYIYLILLLIFIKKAFL